MPIQSISFGVSGGLLALCWLLLLAALGLAVWAYRAPEPPLRSGVRIMLGTLRFVALAILVLTLFQPILTVSGGAGGRPPLPVLIDLSRSMGLPGAVTNGDTLTRLERAMIVLGETVPDLQRRFDVRLFGFGAEVTDLGRGSGERIQELEVAATGGATRLGSALSEIVERRLPAPPPLCLVVSDGGVNAGTDPVATAERLGIPVFTVAVSADSVLEDVWIAECLSNRSAFLGQETSIAVRLGSFLPNPAKTRVRLKEDDRVLSGENVTLPAGAAETEVQLQLRPERLGTRRYRVEVEPMPGEVTDANNHRSLSIEVVEERLQVLVLADEISWDLTFARRALDGDRTLETTVLARLERGSESYRPVGEGKIQELPIRAQELLPFGAIVLVGVDPARLPAATRQAVRAYVTEGGGLILLAGRHGNRLRGLIDGDLAGRLPVRVTGEPLPGLMAPELTAAGLVHPITSFGESPARAGGMWGDLPPIHPTAAIEAALGGEVLVEATMGGRRQAVVIAGPAGTGRALVIGAAGIWRWDMLLKGRGQEDTVFRRLLSEAVRWAAEGRQHGNLELYADRSMFLGGQRVTVGARLTDDRLQPIDDAAIRLEIVPDDGGASVPFQLLPGETRGHYTGDAGFLPAGLYRLRGEAERGAEQWKSEGGHFMVDTADLEGATPAANPGLLRRLAQRSGGALVEADAATEELVAAAEDRREQMAAIEIKLWNHPATFLLFIGVLGFEWLLRRRHGLA